MTLAPAHGERAALRGYRWQYDHIAELVYDALHDDDFEELRLTDPNAGRVDDLVLVRHGRCDAYQFKSGGSGYLTFRDVLRTQQTGGRKIPSLIRSLADGWRNLRTSERDTHVHLVTEQLASVNDRLGDGGEDTRPSPDHFDAFIKRVLAPLQSGSIEIEDVAAGWKPALEGLRQACDLAPGEEFCGFLRALHLDVKAGSGLPERPSPRQSDIVTLSVALQRCVSEASDTVQLDRRQVLQLVGWTGRTTLQSPHEFPVDLDTYAPLSEAIDELISALSAHDSGYVAVTGPPGSGKSTLLSRTLGGTQERVVRYFSFVPGAGPTRTRQTAQAFLHDLVLMLRREGLETHERQLIGGDINELRCQLFQQLEAASDDFRRSRQRTIVIVDGLDHVDREYRGDDALLAELPRPDEVPDGVLFIVGSRTLDPLRPEAQQQVSERQALVDLGQHRLSRRSIIEVCRRAALTAHLEPELHERIADLSGGHPLALGYLLNRLRDAEGEPAADVLAAVPAYSGDVGQEYRAVWAEIEEDDSIVEILEVCSRLRIGFTTQWLSTWAPAEAVRRFRRSLLYLFRPHHDGWRFFHDSFRQFAADQTALADDGPGNVDEDARAHRRVAEICAVTGVANVAEEELYHRYHAHDGDTVLALARQRVFRDHFCQLRSPGLIRDDISIALEVAAARAEVLAIVRLLLALTEVNARASALESINMPALLYKAGLVNEAVAFCDGDILTVPLGQAYELAATLGEANEHAGRRLFDSIEHYGLEDPTRVTEVGREHDTGVAWARAAVQFRPSTAVLDAVRCLVEPDSGDEPRPSHDTEERWWRYAAAMRVVIEERERKCDAAALFSVESELESFSERLEEGAEALDYRAAVVMDLSFRTRAALLQLVDDAAERVSSLTKLASTLRAKPIQVQTALDLAELLACDSLVDEAAELLHRTAYHEALTASRLSDPGAQGTLGQSFQYWRLRFQLATERGAVPEPIQPAEDTPYGNDVRPDAPAHQNRPAIELAGRIDSAVRELARLDAAAAAGAIQSTADAWSAIEPLLDLFPPTSIRGDASVSLIADHKPELMQIGVGVARRCGDDLPQLLSDALERRFDDESRQWSPQLKMDLAESLRAAGASAPWYERTLRECEANAPSEDVHTRLATIEDLVGRYARSGKQDGARRLLRAMIPMTFGIGYRKDYQLDSWVAWLGCALAEPDGARLVDDAAWLARLATAVEPMTEGAPGTAAAKLPALVVPADATAAVRIFEYLVRHGTVDHFSALAALVEALIRQLGPNGLASVELAADLAGELIAPAANDAYPDLAAALIAAAERAGGSDKAGELVKSVAARTDSYALPTSRAKWRKGLGLQTTTADPRDGSGVVSADDFGALVLSDGRRVAPGEVGALIASVDDIVILRNTEADDSHFHWNAVVSQLPLTPSDAERLSDVFVDDPGRHADVLASLAETLEGHGDHQSALRLASAAFEGSTGDAWASYGGGAKRRAAGITVRLGDPDDLVAACRDLVRQAISNRWVAGLLVLDSEAITEALDPNLSASTIWPEVRTYLNGMAETLDLGDPDVLIDHGCRWWLVPRTDDPRASSNDSTPQAALADLAVGHLSHPATLIRDAAITTVVRALKAGNAEVSQALGRFAQPGASDDILERVGRCLAAARSCEGFVTPTVLEPLEHVLATHSSQIIRDLAAYQRPRPSRPLPLAYSLQFLGMEDSRTIGAEPYDGHYRLLARGVGLDAEALLAVASSYRQEATETLPEQSAVDTALKAARVKHVYMRECFAASRAAFGRVVADLRDAGLLDGAPVQVQNLLRSVDLDVLHWTPEGRPQLIPAPPAAGVDKGLDDWLAAVEGRIDEFVASSSREDRQLIGARCRLRILNWDRLQEDVVCGSTVGESPPSDGELFTHALSMTLRDLITFTSRAKPEVDECLILENRGFLLHEDRGNWLAFRPDLAASLGWTPDADRPGRWRTSRGDLAVETIYWVDGWWGRAGPAFDDTEADGYAVVLTARGLEEIVALVGPITRQFVLTRGGLREGSAVEPVTAARTCPADGVAV